MSFSVIPAKAGIQFPATSCEYRYPEMRSRLRGNDGR